MLGAALIVLFGGNLSDPECQQMTESQRPSRREDDDNGDKPDGSNTGAN